MTPSRPSSRLTRRRALQAGAGAVALSALSPWDPMLALALGAPPRTPDSLPDPSRPAGTPTAALPFDHIVVVMMENHSFDNYFGMLPRHGQPLADGFSFDAAGVPTDVQPYEDGYARLYRAPSHCQPTDVTQSWNATHHQIDGGRMDGFARTAPAHMSYWTEEDLPFYYSLARTFTLANRWFGSAPCQTFPNRRFLLAGTAYGLISTDIGSVLDPAPPNGTIFDRLDRYGVSWRNYFTDLPGVGVIGTTVESYPTNFTPAAQFFLDCAAGSLPAVSFVDPEFGATSDIGGALSAIPGLEPIADGLATQGGDEENPQNITLGEDFVARVTSAVLASPAWERTLLVWTYDEHGGYYDHVPPPAAIAPDAIPPTLGPKDVKGGYDIYGPRVPAVVVSPYSRPGAVTDVVHDHTSILATIEAKWNLPACTFRDANAATLADFLDTSRMALAEPPALAAPFDPVASEAACSNANPTISARPYAELAGRLVVRARGRRRGKHGGARVRLRTTTAALWDLTVEVRRHGHVVARTTVDRVTTARRDVLARPVHGKRLKAGRYRLIVKAGHTVLSRQTIDLD